VGVIRLRKPTARANDDLRVSVIVPLHNEQDCLLQTLQALARQDYTGEWEVICINDRSTDSTLALLEDFCQDKDAFCVYSVPMDAPTVASPKKRALDLGFSKAKYEILMTMDADCIPPDSWIRSMANCFTGNVAIVQGPKCILTHPKENSIHRYQKLETLGLTLIEAAGFTLKKPILASAAALAYKKDLYYKVGGFTDLMDFASGDDDMLVHKMAREPVDYCYNADAQAMIYTAPVNTFTGLLNQHARWASNGSRYSNKAYVLLLVMIFLFYCWLMVAPFLAIVGLVPWASFVVPMVFKTLWDVVFLFIGGKKLGCSSFLRYILITEIIQVPVVVFSVIAGHLNLFRWK
jgi:cellulose synthase/poly-beta-1,6-N-acetylglucosamine synthase-like glycosyltransferase